MSESNGKPGGNSWEAAMARSNAEFAEMKARCDAEKEAKRLAAHEAARLALYEGRVHLLDPPRLPDRTSSEDAAAFIPVNIGQLAAQYPRLKPPLIHGLVRIGETCNIIAPSKVGKSWLSYGLGLSIAAHLDWLGTFSTEAGRILLIDNELHPETIAHRIPAVAKALNIAPADYQARFDVLPLRGRLTDYSGLASRLIGHLAAGRYAAVIIDAHYRMLPPGVSENDNAAMAQVYNLIDRYAAETAAAWFLIHHSTKGSQAEKSVVDVGAGAGSQSRAADTHLVLRPHEEAGHVVLEAAVRSWSPVAPLVLRWEFPLWTPATDADPAALKGRQKRAGERQDDRSPEAKADDAALLVALDRLDPEGTNGAGYEQVLGVAQLSKRRMVRAVLRLVEENLIQECRVDVGIGSNAKRKAKGLRRVPVASSGDHLTIFPDHLPAG